MLISNNGRLDTCGRRGRCLGVLVIVAYSACHHAHTSRSASYKSRLTSSIPSTPRTRAARVRKSRRDRAQPSGLSDDKSMPAKPTQDRRRVARGHPQEPGGRVDGQGRVLTKESVDPSREVTQSLTGKRSWSWSVNWCSIVRTNSALNAKSSAGGGGYWVVVTGLCQRLWKTFELAPIRRHSRRQHPAPAE
jgi:hypothetical protein